LGKDWGWVPGRVLGRVDYLHHFLLDIAEIKQVDSLSDRFVGRKNTREMLTGEDVR